MNPDEVFKIENLTKRILELEENLEYEKEKVEKVKNVLDEIDFEICGFVVDDVNVKLADFTNDELISIVESTSEKSEKLIKRIREATNDTK